ncbi:MAG: hypothetical protein ACKVS6_13570 [Planctomycetota bacterium]
MRILVAGPIAETALSIASALASRGHDLCIADRIDTTIGEEAARLWRAWRPGAGFLNLTNIPSPHALRDLADYYHAIVICNNDTGSAFYTDLSISLADAAAARDEARPILKFTDLSPCAGVDIGNIRVRNGACEYKDFPSGIPEIRTLGALSDGDRALRLIATMRDQPILFLRFGELIAPGRLQFSSGDCFNHMTLAALGHERESNTNDQIQYSIDSTSDVADAHALSIVIERLLVNIPSAGAGMFHFNGGPAARITLGQAFEYLQLLQKQQFPFPFSDTAAPEARVLDDRGSRSGTGAPRVCARAAIEQYYHFARRHSAILLASAPQLVHL